MCRSSPSRYPHNLWLEVLCEAGWAAGGMLIAIVVRVAWRLVRASRTEPAAVLLLSLAAFEVVCVSVSGDLNARTFFFVLTLGYAVSWWRNGQEVQPDRRGNSHRVVRPVRA